jgi:hypothetical protein
VHRRRAFVGDDRLSAAPEGPSDQVLVPARGELFQAVQPAVDVEPLTAGRVVVLEPTGIASLQSLLGDKVAGLLLGDLKEPRSSLIRIAPLRA